MGASYGAIKIKNKKVNNFVLLERSSNVEFNYLKIFVIRGHKRSLEVNKGQMGVIIIIAIAP